MIFSSEIPEGPCVYTHKLRNWNELNLTRSAYYQTKAVGPSEEGLKTAF